MLPKALENLVNEFAKLPGIGPRTAERLAFYVLRATTDDAQRLASALNKLHAAITTCAICFNLAEAKLCTICSDSTRDTHLLALVEEPLDVIAIEKTGIYRGLYHVLGGVISPIDGIGPGQVGR